MNDDSTLPETVLAKVRALLNPDLIKADQAVGSPVKKPLGPKSAVKDEAKPASLPGLAAPGNTAGPGRGNKTTPNGGAKTSVHPDNAKTNVSVPKGPAGAGSNQEFLYVSKKDFPQAPKGTVDSTPNSWKVPAGIGRQLQAKIGEAPEEAPTTEAEATSFGKKTKGDTLKKAHLSAGKISSKERTVGDNVSETFKIVIQGNGAGIMKPVVSHYSLKEVSRQKEPGKGPGWKYDPDQEDWTKETTHFLDPTAGQFFGAGAGNLPYKQQPQREVAGYTVAQLHGLDNVPVTVLRNDNGISHSVQEWKDGLKDISSVKKVKDPEGKAQRDIEVLRELVAPEKRKELEQKIMDLAVNGLVINNNDLHAHNFLVDPKTAHVTLIDHGLAFGNGMHGVRNHLLHNVFHKGQPIKMSETLQKRMDNLSFGDYKRAQTGMKDWEAGQSFLRNRYVSWLQRNHGEIDRQKFLHVEGNNDGDLQAPGDPSNWKFAGDGPIEIVNEFIARDKAGMLPNQLFESWSKAFLNNAASDPKHKDHNDAKALSEIGVFMEVGYMGKHGGDSEYRAKGLHKEYEKTIKATFDIPKNISDYMENRHYYDDEVPVGEAGTFNPDTGETNHTTETPQDEAPATVKPGDGTRPGKKRK